MLLLTDDDWPAVRALLDVSLSDTMLSSDTIEQEVFWGAAEREVLRLDPLATTRTGSEKDAARGAVMCLLAALLAPSVPRLTREDVDGYTYQADVSKWDVLATNLRARASREVGAYLQVSDASVRRPTMFAVAHGTRGR